MRALVDRLGRMTREEVAWRTSVLARTRAQRLAFSMRPPRWDRADLRTSLTSTALTPDVMHAVRLGDWLEANRLLLEPLHARQGRFIVDHWTTATLRHALLERWPTAERDAVDRAQRMIGGSYDVLGYRGVDFTRDGGLDWHYDPVHDCRAPGGFWADVRYLDPACGDHKVIWEINRHQHWLGFGRALWLTGDTRYRDAILDQLSTWLDINPPLDGINWASMLELGFRSISWTCALHFLLAIEGRRYNFDGADQPWLVDMLIGLDRQLTHIEHNLSYYFSPNTHLTGEALALYVVGLALPELAGSEKWVEIGRRVLLTELGRQVAADGGHVERSTHYHRYTLDFYLFALLMARRCGDIDAERVFTEAVERLATFMRAMADEAGWLPVIGDDDAGLLWPIAGRHHRDVRDSLALASVVLDRPALSPWGVPEEVYWLAWSTHEATLDGLPGGGERSGGAESAGVQQPLTMRVFADTGYAVMRGGDGDHVIFDVGAHGYLNGGHAHADALAITLGVGGRPLLIDPGTATYTMDGGLRDRMRSSASHNTVTIDHRGASVPAGPFHWASRADAQLEAARHNAGLSWVEASHNGYAPLRHRRSVVHTAAGGWLIVDQVLGRDRHSAQLHWHFDPAWEVTCETNHRLRATHEDGSEAWVLYDGGALWLARGDEGTGLGWCSPSYGTLEPTWSARVSRSAFAPFAMVTWVGTACASPSMQRVRTECDPNGTSLAVYLTCDEAASVILLRPGEPPVRDTRSSNLSGYQTNARLLQYATRGNQFRSLAVADASHVLAMRDGLLSVAADDHLADLHIAVDGDVLALSASQPPPRLRLQGAAVGAIRQLRLNRREAPAIPRGQRDALVIPAADWADPSGTEATSRICAA
jgi:hypothetical protein